MILPKYRVIKESLAAPDGDTIVLYDMLNAPEEGTPLEDFNRNVYRLNASGQCLWQIAPVEGTTARCPFTNIFFDENGKLMAFRWDGFIHEIDPESGQATIVDFWK